jgi:hypothetical protein
MTTHYGKHLSLWEWITLTWNSETYLTSRTVEPYILYEISLAQTWSTACHRYLDTLWNRIHYTVQTNCWHNWSLANEKSVTNRNLEIHFLTVYISSPTDLSLPATSPVCRTMDGHRDGIDGVDKANESCTARDRIHVIQHVVQHYADCIWMLRSKVLCPRWESNPGHPAQSLLILRYPDSSCILKYQFYIRHLLKHEINNDKVWQSHPVTVWRLIQL